MKVYWQNRKRGQNLVLSDDDGDQEEEIGGFRETKRGIDAYARTMGYEPERSRKGFDSVQEAKDFVVSFSPWEIFGVRGVEVDSEARPIPD